MENMNQAIQKAKELLAKADKEKWNVLQEIKEAEEEKQKALQAMETATAKGNISEIKKHKVEAEAYEERISFLKNKSENMSFEDMEDEIEELQAFVKAYAKKKVNESGNVYYQAWIDGQEADLEADKAVNTANWILTQTDRILDRSGYNHIGLNQYKGMFEPSRKEVNFTAVWNEFYRRRREEYLK